MAFMTPHPGRPGSLRQALCILSVVGVLTACSQRAGQNDRADMAAREGTSHAMVGRPAPDFVGDSLTPGGWLGLAGLRETPIAILFFHPGGPFVAELVREFTRFSRDRSMAPTRFMGVVRDSPEVIKQFQRVHGSNLPILRDPGSIFRRYGIGSTPTIVLLDVDHIVRFRLDGFVGAEFRPRLEATAAALRALPDQRAPAARSLRLEFGRYERLPDLITSTLDDGMFRLAETRGRVIVLMFLDSGCSWCGERLSLIIDLLEETPPERAGAVAVVIDPPDERAVRLLRQAGPRLRILIDARQATSLNLPNIEAPELLLVDPEGFVRYRAPRDLDIDDHEFIARLRPQLASVLNGPPTARETAPPARLGARVAHVGDNACRECHQVQYLQWRATPHAAAISPLIQAGRAGDDSCTPCHTTGAGLTAGFGDPLATASMTNVQCESCHGPGFDHVNSPESLRRQTIYGLSGECDVCDLERFCTGCHDADNDPQFNLESALPKVMH